ncbi:hypothetical protein OG730_38500 [Streptomyces sp. NBC_01298]|nr:hypothetical protein OG730_38500 [Streptomyces sp. NBC_01298]
MVLPSRRVKAVADEITTGNDEDGVAAVLERHLLPLAGASTR